MGALFFALYGHCSNAIYVLDDHKDFVKMSSFSTLSQHKKVSPSLKVKYCNIFVRHIKLEQSNSKALP